MQFLRVVKCGYCKPDDISDQQALLLARDIAKKVEDSLKYVGQVKITVIREKRHMEVAK